MKPKALFFVSALLAALAAVPGTAQPPQTRIIALQVNVGPDGSGQPVSYGVRPNSENVPLQPGQRVRVSLVGTAIVNGIGVERPVNARFHPVAGGGALELGQSGPNWVIVRGRSNGGNGLAQLAYDVTDRGYTMKAPFESGRITFQLAGNDVGGTGGNGGNGGGYQNPGPVPNPNEGGDRLAASQRIAQRLYQAILKQNDLSGRRAQNDVDAINRGGYPAIQTVARDLAVVAESNGSFDRRSAEEVVGRFYRELLRRNGSAREIADQDRGFLDNVQLLRDRGLPELVRVIVGSQEFQKVQELDRYGLLYGPSNQGRDRGYDRGGNRGGDPNRDYRRPPL
ncbi:MAG TPA: hypothetical protein VGR07_13580 [Thermoanaerobaculia bacterium]|nr:hypothetical protein [Thermoanaerobaculia bacterium]